MNAPDTPLQSKLKLHALAAELERAARENAQKRVKDAIEPLMSPLVQDLRRALHRVVGTEADVLVLELVNVLRSDLARGASAIAEQQAIHDIVGRLTAETAPAEQQAAA